MILSSNPKNGFVWAVPWSLLYSGTERPKKPGSFLDACPPFPEKKKCLSTHFQKQVNKMYPAKDANVTFAVAKLAVSWQFSPPSMRCAIVLCRIPYFGISSKLDGIVLLLPVSRQLSESMLLVLVLMEGRQV